MSIGHFSADDIKVLTSVRLTGGNETLSAG